MAASSMRRSRARGRIPRCRLRVAAVSGTGWGARSRARLPRSPDYRLRGNERGLIGAAGQLFDLASMIDRFAGRFIMREQLEGLRLVVGHRRHGLVGIRNVRAFGDAAIDAKDAPGRRRDAGVLVGEFPGHSRIEAPDRLDRQFGPALMTVFEPDETALQRVDLLDRERLREPQDDLRQAENVDAVSLCPPQNRLDVFR